MNLCPFYKNLVSVKDIINSKIYKDNFFNDKFELTDDEKIVHIKEIRANTPIPFSVLLLICQNWKEQPQIYCNLLNNPQAEKKACESNKTDYIFFYIKKWLEEKSENKPNEYPMYILAFVHYSENDDEIKQKITDEIKRTAKWLCISECTIQCYIFYYTTGHLCNTFDWGALKEKYNDLCNDPKYIFQFQYVPQNEKSQYLSVNEGSPWFTIKVQEM